MPAGRPSKYNKTILKKTQEFMDGGYKDSGAVIPTLEGLALYLGLVPSTVHKWANEDGNKPEFSEALRRITAMQRENLLTGGLTGSYNASIAKLLLSHNHGVMERSQVDTVSSDGSMSPQKIELVAGGEE